MIAVWFSLVFGIKTTWLSLGQDHGLDLNNVGYVCDAN